MKNNNYVQLKIFKKKKERTNFIHRMYFNFPSLNTEYNHIRLNKFSSLFFLINFEINLFNLIFRESLLILIIYLSNLIKHSNENLDKLLKIYKKIIINKKIRNEIRHRRYYFTL